jgi:hypothetical protein
MKHDSYTRYLLCSYLSKETVDFFSKNEEKRFEFLSLIPGNCEWSDTLKAFRRIQKTPELKPLLKIRNHKNQTIFDMVEADMVVGG